MGKDRPVHAPPDDRGRDDDLLLRSRRRECAAASEYAFPSKEYPFAAASMRRSVKRILTLALGGILVLLGIAGLFLPFLQGVLLILAGLYLLSRESETARSWLATLKRRFPGLDRRSREISRKARDLLRRRP